MTGFDRFVKHYKLTKEELMECRFPTRLLQEWLHEGIIENQELLEKIDGLKSASRASTSIGKKG